ncbi:hypothetical protein [Lacticaseibacillus brantae]|nr:hypothetical protein [Lacticaseibacillus brantae]
MTPNYNLAVGNTRLTVTQLQLTLTQATLAMTYGDTTLIYSGQHTKSGLVDRVVKTVGQPIQALAPLAELARQIVAGQLDRRVRPQVSLSAIPTAGIWQPSLRTKSPTLTFNATGLTNVTGYGQNWLPADWQNLVATIQPAANAVLDLVAAMQNRVLEPSQQGFNPVALPVTVAQGLDHKALDWWQVGAGGWLAVDQPIALSQPSDQLLAWTKAAIPQAVGQVVGESLGGLTAAALSQGRQAALVQFEAGQMMTIGQHNQINGLWLDSQGLTQAQVSQLLVLAQQAGLVNQRQIKALRS